MCECECVFRYSGVNLPPLGPRCAMKKRQRCRPGTEHCPKICNKTCSTMRRMMRWWCIIIEALSRAYMKVCMCVCDVCCAKEMDQTKMTYRVVESRCRFLLCRWLLCFFFCWFFLEGGGGSGKVVVGLCDFSGCILRSCGRYEAAQSFANASAYRTPIGPIFVERVKRDICSVYIFSRELLRKW